MQPQNVFINYTNPSQQSDRRQRQKVASYIGTYYRNRSRPAARREKEQSNGEPANQGTASHKARPKIKPKALQVLSWRLRTQAPSPLRDHDMHGFKIDPFQSYPITATNRLPQVIEYCMYQHLDFTFG